MILLWEIWWANGCSANMKRKLLRELTSDRKINIRKKIMCLSYAAAEFGDRISPSLAGRALRFYQAKVHSNRMGQVFNWLYLFIIHNK